MELRKKIKRPERYEPERLTRLDPTYAPRATRPAFRINYVDFNPALPPAKFPTLKYPKVSKNSEYLTRSSGSGISSLNREGVTSQSLWRDHGQEVLDVPYNANDRREGKDGVQDQFPVGIMQQLQKSKGDQNGEWLFEELVMSDDEEVVETQEEQETGVKARSEAAPHFMNLPIPLQLTIVDTLSTNLTVGTVFQRLRLTSVERNKILRQFWLRGSRGRSENANIQTMHTEQLRLLLNDRNHGFDAITRSEFGKTFEDHLYKHINVEEDYHTITKKDLVDARIVLRQLGLDPDLAGEWSEIEDQYLTNESQSVAASVTMSAGPRLKLTMSLHSKVPPQPSAGTKHQTTALAKSLERSTPTMPVKRVLFADKARAPKSMGAAAGPTSELEFASIRVLPPSNLRKRSLYKDHNVKLKDNAAEMEQASSS